MSLEEEVAGLTTATTDLLQAVNVSKAALDQAVADAGQAAILHGLKYATVAEGRAAVADGESFMVQGSGYIAATEYRRTSSTTQDLITQYPSSEGVEAGVYTTYTSKALLEAVAPFVPGQLKSVFGDPDPLNDGDYMGTPGGNWIKQGESTNTLATMARRNGFIITGDITKLRFISSGPNQNAIVVDHEELNINYGSGRGFVKVTLGKDLVIPMNQALILDLRGVDALTGPTVTPTITTIDTASSTYGVGAFVDDMRFPLIVNRSANNILRVGGLLSTKVDYYSTGDVWVFTAAQYSVSYDDSTRTLSTNGLMFCPFQGNKSNRINLPAFSIVLPDTTYQFVWIDKTMVPADGGVLPLEAIKVGGYNNDLETDYQSMPHQLGIFYRERTGKYGPIGGFPAPNPPPPTPATPTTGLSFVKQVNSASLYFDGAGNNKVEMPFLHEMVPYDGTTYNSQSDNWRLFGGWETDANRVRGNQIASTGEYEMALRIIGAGDSVGGYHGDELLTDATWFLNGAPFAQTATKPLTNAKSVGLIQNSFVYKENVQADIDTETGQQTGANAAMKHHKDYRASPDGILLRQRTEFLQDLSIVSAWTTLLPFFRYMNLTSGPLITDRIMRSRNGIIEDISTWVTGSTPVTIEVREGDTFLLYGTTSGICIECTINRLPHKLDGTLVGNPKMYISTNTEAYNKLYVNLRGSSSEGDPNIAITAGDIWLWETFIKVTTAN